MLTYFSTLRFSHPRGTSYLLAKKSFLPGVLLEEFQRFRCFIVAQGHLPDTAVSHAKFSNARIPKR